MLKKLKSIFIVQDEGATSPAPQTSNQNTGNKDLNTPAEPIPTTRASTSNVTPSDKFVNLLLSAIEKNNIEGFDYLEFKNTVRSLENVIPEEGMRFKSAFQMATTMKVSKEKLIQSAEHYIKVLHNEEKSFHQALENQKNLQITERKQQLSSLNQLMKEKENQIAVLQQQILESQKQMESLQNDIAESDAKISTTDAQFMSSYNMVLKQIVDDIEKIKVNI